MGKRMITESRIREFCCYLWQEEREAGTIEKYSRDVRKLAAWLEGQEVTKELAIRWKEHLRESSYNPVTINSMLAVVNRFFRFCGWEDCRVKALRLQRTLFRNEKRELTREEYQRLVTAARQRGDERLALLMETICATGIRVSEVRYITVEAVREEQAEISLKGKVRTILLPGKLCRKLQKYAKGKKIASGEIFLTRGGVRLSRRFIWAEMKRLCQAAKVAPDKVFPHNLRHLFARTFYRACRDIVQLADVLGHSSIETTRIYLVATGEEHRKRLDNLRLLL